MGKSEKIFIKFLEQYAELIFLGRVTASKAVNISLYRCELPYPSDYKNLKGF